MSKLQKALERLRSGQATISVSPAGGATTGDGRRYEAARGPDSSRVRIRTRGPSEMNPDERLPDRTLHVDFRVLRDEGLWPAENDAERIAQQFRRIKRPVINSAFGVGMPEADNANMIMMASALPRSGKTWCSVNLAASIARERDIGAVLVDADVLKPNISRVLGLDDHVGLIDHLLDPAVGIDDIIVPTDLHNIVVIPAGQQHPEATELLASRRMETFVSAISRRFCTRAVLVDTPPLLVTNEAHVLAEHMGQIVLVIEAGVSSQDSVIQALDSLNQTKPINAILNKARSGVFDEYTYGAYGYYSVPMQDPKYAEPQEE